MWLFGLGNNFNVNFPGSNLWISTVDGQKYYATYQYQNSVPNRGGGNGQLAACAAYANGYYFAFGPTNGGDGSVSFASEPYNPTSNFQVPILKNDDGTYRYIKVS